MLKSNNVHRKRPVAPGLAIVLGFLWLAAWAVPALAAERAGARPPEAKEAPVSIRAVTHRRSDSSSAGIEVRFDGSADGVEIIREGDELIVRFAAASVPDTLLGIVEVEDLASPVERYELTRFGPIVNLVVSQREGVRKAEARLANRRVVLGFQTEVEKRERPAKAADVAPAMPEPLAAESPGSPAPPSEMFGPPERVLDPACYGGDAWITRLTESTDAEALRIRALRAWESFRDCEDCPEMKVIPDGEFVMGSPARPDGRASDEGPQHREWIRSFAVAKFELEWSSFQRFIDATRRVEGSACRTLSEGNGNWDIWAGLTWTLPGYVQQPNHPVVCVTWEDAQAYVQWLSAQTGKRYRLLSEAEWEYAARATVPGPDYWTNRGRDAACAFGNFADQTSSGDFNWIERFSCSDRWWLPAPVGTYRANQFGLYDMLGNVWEWVEDCSSPDYTTAAGDGRPRTCGQCERRIIRGASWSTRPSGVRFANRARAQVDRRSVTIGFRVARDLE